MKITILVVVALFLNSFSLFAQATYSIKGSVGDTASRARLENATICILNSKDSILYKFTRASATGSFALNDLVKGKYILMASYPDYADYIETFQLDSVKKEIDFGRINMILKSRVLSEIMVKGTKAAIKINGDTTEFNASSYVIQPNSKVEDLLKQLPGIQVDKDGKITAQGQPVNKVLVDGEEFFGDDPTLVTKNIRGDMVDKVQLYDKKSDQATFTGIDDGIKNKTINLKLKEDKKNGYFGKVSGGVGTDQFYEGQGMFNYFKAKEKLSVYGTLANTGKIGLGWQDNSKYGASNNLSLGDDGNFTYTSGNDELESFDGTYNGQGIPLARTGGVHYDTKWDADKQSINGNYKLGYLSVTGDNNTLTQNNLPTGVLNSNSDQTYKKSIFRQKADGVYQLKIDSLSNLKISLDGTIKHSDLANSYSASSYRGFDTLLNKSTRNLTNNVDTKILNASIFYNKKFKKVGRSFSWNISEAYNQSDTHGYLNSDIDFYNAKTGLLDSTQLINQYKTSNVVSSNLNSNITYSEPFTKEFALILNYGTGLNNSSADRKSFDESTTGQYDKLNNSLSNNYQFDQLSNQLGASFSYKKNKTILSFGAKATAVRFEQTDEYTGSVFKRNFLNWTPRANYQYKFSQQGALNLTYSGNTTQPTIDQIQPVLVNTDPLNITLGNPDLKASFRNNLRFNYNSYKVLSGQDIYLSGSIAFVSNPIVSNTVTDTTGKTTFRSSNLAGKKPLSYNLYGNFDQKIKAIDLSVGVNLGFNGSTTYNYSNNVLNTTQSYDYVAGLSLSKYQEKKYSMYIGFGPNYTVGKSSLQPNINNNGFGLQGNSSFDIFLPGKFEIGTDDNYQYTAKTQSFDQDFSKLIVNASISKKFLKEDNLKFSVSANDLLNQNVGFSRSTYSSTITQNSYTSIKRYFMFSISYDFSKMGGAPAKK